MDMNIDKRIDTKKAEFALTKKQAMLINYFVYGIGEFIDFSDEDARALEELMEIFQNANIRDLFE